MIYIIWGPSAFLACQHIAGTIYFICKPGNKKTIQKCHSFARVWKVQMLRHNGSISKTDDNDDDNADLWSDLWSDLWRAPARSMRVAFAVWSRKSCSKNCNQEAPYLRGFKNFHLDPTQKQLGFFCFHEHWHCPRSLKVLPRRLYKRLE
jgi:hypothetical protein